MKKQNETNPVEKDEKKQLVKVELTGTVEEITQVGLLLTQIEEAMSQPPQHRQRYFASLAATEELLPIVKRYLPIFREAMLATVRRKQQKGSQQTFQEFIQRVNEKRTLLLENQQPKQQQ